MKLRPMTKLDLQHEFHKLEGDSAWTAGVRSGVVKFNSSRFLREYMQLWLWYFKVLTPGMLTPYAIALLENWLARGDARSFKPGGEPLVWVTPNQTGYTVRNREQMIQLSFLLALMDDPSMDAMLVVVRMLQWNNRALAFPPFPFTFRDGTQFANHAERRYRTAVMSNGSIRYGRETWKVLREQLLTLMFELIDALP